MSTKKEQQREYRVQFVKFWLSLPTNEKVLKVFKRSDYYSVYGKPATEYIATQFFKTKKCIRLFGADNKDKANKKYQVECVHFKQTMYESIIRDFVNRQENVVHIYTNTDEGWQITQKLTLSSTSAGGAEEESAFNLIAVRVNFSKNQQTVGIALFNHSLFRFEIAQFIDDLQFSKLHSVLIAKGVKQILFETIGSKNQNQQEIANLNNCIKKAHVQPIDVSDDKFWSFTKQRTEDKVLNINKVIDKASKKRLNLYSNHNHAIDALHGIILNQNLLTDAQYFAKYSLKEYQIDSCMRLDAAALGALNLFPSLRGGQGSFNENASLYGVLKKCKSAMGDRLLSIWIRQPLVRLSEIHRRQKLVKLFVENNEQREILRNEHMKSLIDLAKIRRKLESNKATLKDLVDLHNFATKIRWIGDAIAQCHDVDFDDGSTDGDQDDDVKMSDANANSEKPIDILQRDFTEKMKAMEKNFNNFIALIEQVVDLPKTEQRQYLVNHTFDSQLNKFDKKKKKTMKQMQKVKENTAKSLKIKESNIKLEKKQSSGYLLRILKSACKTISKHRDYTRVSMLKAASFYSNKELRSLSKSYIGYEKDYENRQKVIIQKCIDITITYLSVINECIDVFSELDVILSFAHVASNAPSTYCLPKIFDINPSQSDSDQPRKIFFKGARHPCLELVQMSDGMENSVIANDVDLIYDKSSFQIVTGPNMGGKSTYIRMIGLITLMCQIGSYVPCDEASMCIVDCILARVGAGDNQLKGISTFMAEMLETVSILTSSTSKSLIIIDELGRGTSTYDGFGIAYSISEHIALEKKCFCLFATHFHELAELAVHKNVVNKYVMAHVDNTDDTMTMLYKIQSGTCPQSFGIQVARLAKFPSEVIDIAKKKADTLERTSHSLSMMTFNSIQKILRLYKTNVVDAAKANEWKPNDENYKKALDELKSVIEKESNGDNKELSDLVLNIEKNLKSQKC